MKFVCLGYYDEREWEAAPEAEMKAFMEQCFAFDDELRRGGHWIGGEALQSFRNAATISLKDGKPVVTDGPYAETKEQIGGILFLEARDLTHAIALMSKHPGLRAGPFEIRPADESINELIAARNAKS